MLNEVKSAFRRLRRRPSFTAPALSTLALGLGAGASLFSLAFNIAVRPLPYPQPQNLIRISEADLASGVTHEEVSQGAFQDIRDGTHALESVALFSKVRQRRLRGPDGQKLTTMGVSPSLFDLLGVRPALGPGFTQEADGRVAREVVLSDAAWHRLFSGRADIIGSTMGFGDDGSSFTVVGVMPAAFAFADPVDLWQPKVVALPVPSSLYGLRAERAVARLRSGVGIDQAQSELEVVTAKLAQGHPATNKGWALRTESLHAAIVGRFGQSAWLLFAIAAVLVILTAVNVRCLLLARSLGRGNEASIRMALGASTWQLAQSRLVDTILLGLGGGGLALVAASIALGVLKASAPPGIPRLSDIGIDGPTIVELILSTFVAAGVLIVPVDAGTSVSHLVNRLRGVGASAEDARHNRARTALVAFQCAGAVLLTIFAGLFVRSYVNLTRLDLGWSPNKILAVQVTPPAQAGVRRPWFGRVRWSDALLPRLAETPGFAQAALTTQLPLIPSPNSTSLGRGKGNDDAAEWSAQAQAVSDNFFQTMTVQVVDGRPFNGSDAFSQDELDGTTQPDHGAAIVSKDLERTLWPGQSGIGKAIRLPDIDNVPWREVVGVTNGLHFSSVGGTDALQVFLPFSQWGAGTPFILVKGAGSQVPTAATVASVALSVAAGSDVNQATSLDQLVSAATSQPRFTGRIVAMLGLFALTLAGIGLYGTIGYLVTTRRREIGLRMALGASRSQVVAEMLRLGLLPAAWGGLIGTLVAATFGRGLRGFLFGIEPTDWVSVTVGLVALGLVAILASLVPSLRASRTDPSAALRGN